MNSKGRNPSAIAMIAALAFALMMTAATATTPTTAVFAQTATTEAGMYQEGTGAVATVQDSQLVPQDDGTYEIVPVEEAAAQEEQQVEEMIEEVATNLGIPPSVRDEIIHHLEFALAALDAGDVASARVDIIAARDLIQIVIDSNNAAAAATVEEEQQQQQAAAEEEQQPTAAEIAQNATTATELPGAAVPTQPQEEEPVAGNAVQPEQVFGGTAFEDCIEQIIQAGFVIVETTVEQQASQTGNTEAVNEIQNNPEVVEQAMNDTGVTDQMAEVVGDAVTDVASGEITADEASQEITEEIIDIGQENSDEIVEEIVS
jgi:hypothetical protein